MRKWMIIMIFVFSISITGCGKTLNDTNSYGDNIEALETDFDEVYGTMKDANNAIPINGDLYDYDYIKKMVIEMRPYIINATHLSRLDKSYLKEAADFQQQMAASEGEDPYDADSDGDFDRNDDAYIGMSERDDMVIIGTLPEDLDL